MVRSSALIALLAACAGDPPLEETGTPVVPTCEEQGTCTAPAQVTGPRSGSITEDGPTAVVEGTLVVTDPDPGEAAMQPASLDGTYGTLVLVAEGTWTYTLDNSRVATDALAAGDEDTDAFDVFTADDTLVTLTVDVLGANDAPTLTPADFTLPENTANDVVVGTLGVVDPDDGDTHVIDIVDGDPGGAFGVVGHDLVVADTFQLDYETQTQWVLTLQVTDDAGATGTITSTVDLEDGGLVLYATDSRQAVAIAGGELVLQDNSSPTSAQSVGGSVSGQDQTQVDRRLGVEVPLTKIAGRTVREAVVRFRPVSSSAAGGDAKVSTMVAGFTGDGSVTVEDLQDHDALGGPFVSTLEDGVITSVGIDLDVTEFVQELLDAGAPAAGFALRSDPLPDAPFSVGYSANVMTILAEANRPQLFVELVP